MAKKVTLPMLERIFFKTVEKLEEKLDSNEVTPQDFKTILKLMSDMGVEVDERTSNDIISSLVSSLPKDIEESEYNDFNYSHIRN